MQPPGVSGQMGGGGANPYAGLGDMLKDRMGGGGDDAAGGAPPPGGGADPMGQVKVQVEAIDKVLQQIARSVPSFGPYGDRALQVIKMGLSAAAASSQSQTTPPEPNGTPSMVTPLSEGGR